MNRGLTVEQAKPEIQALYAEQDRGLEAKNPQQAVSHTAPDFVATSSSRQKSTADALAKGLGGLFYHGSNIHSKQTITDLKIDGNKATVTVTSDMTSNVINTTRNPVAGQSALCEDKGTFVDVWTKEADGWVCHSSTATSSSSTTDGQLEPQ